MDRTANRSNSIVMKYGPALALSVGLMFSASWADEKQKFADQKDKESYSLGYQFGQTLKKQGIEINLDIYAAAIRDALAGKESLISREEIRVTTAELQKRVQAAWQEKQKEAAAKNLAEAKAFLEENEKKEGVTALPSGLQFKVLKEGMGKTPVLSDTVTVHYRGTLIDGTEFDSSLKRGKSATFKVDGVIKGWTEALQLMKEGSKWQLFVPPGLAYGERGSKVIPPNSALIFEVELISAAPGK